MSGQADETKQAPPSRGRLIRDTLVFQIKLFVDGLRDLVFSPISLFLALIDLIFGGNRFYRLINLGRRSERYINLFGTHADDDEDPSGLDETVTRIEQLVTDEYRKGGITASARRAVNRALDNLNSNYHDRQHSAKDSAKTPDEKS